MWRSPGAQCPNFPGIHSIVKQLGVEKWKKRRRGFPADTSDRRQIRSISILRIQKLAKRQIGGCVESFPAIFFFFFSGGGAEIKLPRYPTALFFILRKNRTPFLGMVFHGGKLLHDGKVHWSIQLVIDREWKFWKLVYLTDVWLVQEVREPTAIDQELHFTPSLLCQTNLRLGNEMKELCHKPQDEKIDDY